jgi:hypothetical protein
MDMIKAFGVFLLSLLFGLLSLLVSRHVLCDDIIESIGKTAFKKWKPKNPFKWFLLTDFFAHIKRWHYIVFLLEMSFCLFANVIITFIVATGGNQALRNALSFSIIISSFSKFLLLAIPWGKYRN